MSIIKNKDYSKKSFKLSDVIKESEKIKSDFFAFETETTVKKSKKINKNK